MPCPGDGLFYTEKKREGLRKKGLKSEPALVRDSFTLKNNGKDSEKVVLKERQSLYMALSLTAWTGFSKE